MTEPKGTSSKLDATEPELAPLAPIIAEPTPPASTPPLIDEDELKIHRLYRERIVQEDNLINHRMMWMLLSQAFMFALWAAVLKGADQRPSYLSLFSYIVDGTGFAFAVSSGISLAAARGEIKELRKKYLELFPPDSPLDEASKSLGRFVGRTSARKDILPGLTGSKHFHWTGHGADVLVPIWVAGLWALLGLLQSGLLARYGIG